MSAQLEIGAGWIFPLKLSELRQKSGQERPLYT